MEKVLALALRSMQHDMKRVERIAVNMANATTPAYKREMVVERPFAEMVSNQLQVVDSQSEKMPSSSPFLEFISDQRVGAMRTTGQKLDVAIAGEGYFEVSTPSGMTYTRMGSFQIDARGRLVTMQGEAVMGKSGEIILNSNQPRIDADGKIFDTIGTVNDTAIAQLKIVQLNKSDLSQKNQFGNYLVNNNATLNEVKRPQLLQGHIENSNVSSMEETVHLIHTMRHFESMQRVAQGYDDMMGVAIKKLGESS